MQILIIGFGSTGKHLAQLAIEAGYNVWATTRNKEYSSVIQTAGATPVLFGDPLPNKLTHILITAPPHEGKDPFLQRYSLELPHTLKWLGYYSTTGVYGDAQGEWVDEDSPLNAKNKRALARISCEKDYKATKSPLAILRLSGIYSNERNVIQRLKEGCQTLPDEAGPICRIHVDDIASLTLRLMEKEMTGTFNISDDAPSSSRSTVLAACKKLNTRPDTLEKSSSMSKGFSGEGFRRVSNKKIKNALKAELKYPSFEAFLNEY
jgi:nucleoside-diphosphate-sugar epimerase